MSVLTTAVRGGHWTGQQAILNMTEGCIEMSPSVEIREDGKLENYVKLIRPAGSQLDCWESVDFMILAISAPMMFRQIIELGIN